MTLPGHTLAGALFDRDGSWLRSSRLLRPIPRRAGTRRPHRDTATRRSERFRTQRSAPQVRPPHIAGDRDHVVEHGLDAGRARPRSETAARAGERGAVEGPHRPQPALRALAIQRHSVSPPPRACGEIHVQAEREDHDETMPSARRANDSLRCSPAARCATRHVQRACGRATKHPGKNVLHDLSRRDADLRRT
jgi:hypothetical protein